MAQVFLIYKSVIDSVELRDKTGHGRKGSREIREEIEIVCRSI